MGTSLIGTQASHPHWKDVSSCRTGKATTEYHARGCKKLPKIVIHEYAEGFALRLALILSIHVELETGK
jgi:hypothetical protein